MKKFNALAIVAALVVLFLVAVPAMADNTYIQGTNGQIRGNGNSLTINTNQVNGATSVSQDNTQIVVIPQSTVHYSLMGEIGPVPGNIMAINLGSALVVPIGDEGYFPHRGATYNISWISSVPINVRVIDGIDKAKVLSNDGVRTWDDAYQQYDPNGIAHAKGLGTDSGRLYPKGSMLFVVTEQDPKTYSVVFDTRNTEERAGTFQITDNTAEITYSIQYEGVAILPSLHRTIIGTVSPCQTDKNGKIISC